MRRVAAHSALARGSYETNSNILMKLPFYWWFFISTVISHGLPSTGSIWNVQQQKTTMTNPKNLRFLRHLALTSGLHNITVICPCFCSMKKGIFGSYRLQHHFIILQKSTPVFVAWRRVYLNLTDYSITSLFYRNLNINGSGIIYSCNTHTFSK